MKKIKKVKIYGAGSIGNHLAHASRRMGWEVTVVDVDGAALERMKGSIYPSRYGEWDEGIALHQAESDPKGGFDLIGIGTPPPAHLPLASAALDEEPAAILIEKPMCNPDLAGADDFYAKARGSASRVFVGYDHVVGQSATKAVGLVKAGEIGEVLSFDVEFREFWGGIFAAHPWLDGPHDSYLGYWQRGGGACGEHSHAISLWLYLAQAFGFGHVAEVQGMLKYVDDGRVNYDELCSLNLRTESGMCGRVVQDVITQPSKKVAFIQGTKGNLSLFINYDKQGDAIRIARVGEDEVWHCVHKTRPDDFIAELSHLDQVVSQEGASPISMEHGLETMLVVAAAHRSQAHGRTVRIAGSDRTYGEKDLKDI